MKQSSVIITLLLGCGIAIAQIPGLGGNKLPGIPGVENLFKKGPAITTSLKDAKWEAPNKDDFNPEEKSLKDLERGPNGGFILKEGAYGANLESYCLHAGTHGPGGGDCYLYAPPKGPYEKAVIAVCQNSVKHTDIPQRKIQLLLWAMIARTKFSDLQPDLREISTQLLTPQQILDMNGGAMGFISDELMQRGLVKEPPFVQQVMQAENQLRQQLTLPTAKFEDLEKIAVLTGDIEKGKGSREAPRGRWSLHPDGYYVRYMPSGYSNTHLEIYVEPGSKCIGKEFDPATHIAVPCDTNRQRLIQSGRILY